MNMYVTVAKFLQDVCGGLVYLALIVHICTLYCPSVMLYVGVICEEGIFEAQCWEALRVLWPSAR